MAILKEAESGVKVPDLSRKHGMSDATCYKWRAKYGGMDTSMMKRMKELEEENQRLKKMYAEERLKAELSSDNMFIADWLLPLTEHNRNWGFGLCYLYLRNVKGFTYNHKRVYRIYRERELNLCIKPRRRLKCDLPEALSVPPRINTMWSMDFMDDTLADGTS